VEGMGLGLSIVKDAVGALGGRVWATFPPGGGSCFALALPARRTGERGAGDAVDPASAGSPGGSRPGTRAPAA
jgi:signal transduction histidine kinase